MRLSTIRVAARSIALSVVCGACLVSPPRAESQTARPAATAFELRLAETQPAAGLVEAAVPDSSTKVYLHAAGLNRR
jgi:hypothetical protein